MLAYCAVLLCYIESSETVCYIESSETVGPHRHVCCSTHLKVLHVDLGVQGAACAIFTCRQWTRVSLVDALLHKF